jgi:hypothetical protein
MCQAERFVISVGSAPPTASLNEGAPITDNMQNVLMVQDDAEHGNRNGPRRSGTPTRSGWRTSWSAPGRTSYSRVTTETVIRSPGGCRPA